MPLDTFTQQPIERTTAQGVLHVGALVQNTPVTPRQLVLRGPSEATAELDLVSNDGAAAPLSFEDAAHNVRVPHYGDAALLRAAWRGLNHGFDVRRVELGSARQSDLSDTTEAEVSEDVIDALTEGGAEGARDLLRTAYGALSIDGVRFYSPETRSIILRRNGVIFGATEDALWLFIHRVLEERDNS
ncbi:hypothetical protein [Microbacterium oleivorans]|uniref:Uncharacterized protein n=1 Tax=Microbacterium oleivorans TaxID=273677 RepID=A0A4R5YJT5_9MICO|nr:hypothetical protein [Microbacterium oleivorans]TDL45229.1 hypothetical protein E2R54_01800 [Microbacterium oleivorans]